MRIEQRSGAKGRGVFALEPIQRGQRIVALEGRLLPTAALTDDLLAMQVDHDLWLCSDGSSLDDMINHITMRVIDQFDIHLDVMNRWDGVLLDRKRTTEGE